MRDNLICKYNTVIDRYSSVMFQRVCEAKYVFIFLLRLAKPKPIGYIYGNCHTAFLELSR